MGRGRVQIFFDLFRGTFRATADGPMAILALVIIAVLFLIMLRQ
jgi:hypothetical protein